MHATLEEFLDRQRPGLASTYLTRLKVGPTAGRRHRRCPQLYSGRVRPWHVLLVLLAGLVAVAAAIAVTPVGQQWAARRPQPAVGSPARPSPRTLLVISFRYHVVSLVAVFLALAVGVALGGGPLGELGRAEPARPAAADARPRSEAEHAAAFGDQVVDRRGRARSTPTGWRDRSGVRS